MAKSNKGCAAICCKNTYNNIRGVKKLSFFRFPRDGERCKQWVANCPSANLDKKTPQQLNANYMLCGEHFEDRMFMNARSRDKLVHNAVPTVFNFLKLLSSVASVQKRKLPKGKVVVSKESKTDDHDSGHINGMELVQSAVSRYISQELEALEASQPMTSLNESSQPMTPEKAKSTISDDFNLSLLELVNCRPIETRPYTSQKESSKQTTPELADESILPHSESLDTEPTLPHIESSGSMDTEEYKLTMLHEESTECSNRIQDETAVMLHSYSSKPMSTRETELAKKLEHSTTCLRRARVQLHRLKKSRDELLAAAQRQAAKNSVCSSCQEFSYLTQFQQQFFRSQIRACKFSKLGMRFTEEDKLLAQGVYTRSPAAYRFLSSLFSLPTERHLQCLASNSREFLSENVEKEYA